MITLFSTKGACSMAPHIVLEELDLPHQIIELKFGETPEGWAELKKYNPMGQVPTLITEEGYGLAEGPAIMQYLVTKKPNDLMPGGGEMRFRALEWLNFVSSGIHAAYSPLFSPEGKAPGEYRERLMKSVHRKLAAAEQRLAGDYALGTAFTIVDAYLYVILSWSSFVGVSLENYPKLQAYTERLRTRPAVKRAYHSYSPNV